MILVLCFSANILKAQPKPTLNLNNKTTSHYDTLGTIPPFQFVDIHGIAFTPDSLKKNTKTVLMFFDPDCESCEWEAETIFDDMALFPNTQFLMITSADGPAVHRFIVEEGADRFSNVHVLRDPEANYFKFYVVHFTPSLHVFDESGHLLIYKDGRLSEDELKKYLSAK